MPCGNLYLVQLKEKRGSIQICLHQAEAGWLYHVRVIYDSIEPDIESTGGLKCQNYTRGLLKPVRSNEHSYWCLSGSLGAERTAEANNPAASSKRAESGALFGSRKSVWIEEPPGYSSVCQSRDCYRCRCTPQQASASRSRPLCRQRTERRQAQVGRPKASGHRAMGGGPREQRCSPAFCKKPRCLKRLECSSLSLTLIISSV